MKYIITGTGRCGTLYVARLLTSLGYPCTREGIFAVEDDPSEALSSSLNRIHHNSFAVSEISQDREGDWYNFEKYPCPIADASYMAAPFLLHEELEEVKVVHLVRHPVKVIFSFLRFGYFGELNLSKHFKWENHIHHYLPDAYESNDPVENACMFYLGWNEMIEKRQSNYFFHRIEDGEGPLLEHLGIDPTEDMYSNKKCNTNNAREIFGKTWGDIPDSGIKSTLLEIAKRYGYGECGQGFASFL